MKTRENLIALRPTIETISNNIGTSAVETFQNNSIRPILKFQNELIVSIYQKYTEKFHERFYSLTITQREFFIGESIQKDTVLKNIFLGTVIGLFTLSEYNEFIMHEKELKKRIAQMIVQRLQDQIGKFELN
jgi:hypothetical protein